MFNGKFFGGDDTFGLVTDVKQHLITINFYDSAFNKISVVEVFDGGIDCSLEGLRSSNVVDSDL